MRIYLTTIIISMKTIKKAAIALLFLAPLFLPAQSKAGGFDDWFRTLIQQRSNNHPVTPAGSDRFRPYNPPCPPGRPGGSPGTNGNGNSVPIDGGLVFLLAAGVLLGAKTIYDRKRSVVMASR